MNAGSMPADDGDFMTPEWMEQRAIDLAAMNAHALMKNNGILDDDGLAGWLMGACVQGFADYFDGFSILFGFDRHGQDFIVVKSETQGGLHFALTAEEGKRK